jgi:serine/threonine-protein kinase HipA
MRPFSGVVCAPGCLTAEPPAPKRQYNRTHQLAELIAAAQAIEDGKPVPMHLLEQLDPGTSMGGARPRPPSRARSVCGWVSFPPRTSCSLQRIEYATLDIARRAA